MSTPIRRSYKQSKGFSPATLNPTIEVPIAEDNLVCCHCKMPLGIVEWTVVSLSNHKGIVAFACTEHVPFAMNKLAPIGGVKAVPTDLKLPNAEDN